MSERFSFVLVAVDLAIFTSSIIPETLKFTVEYWGSPSRWFHVVRSTVLWGDLPGQHSPWISTWSTVALQGTRKG